MGTLERDRGDEITPEMIEAAFLPLLGYDPDRDDWRDVAREIYKAMRDAQIRQMSRV